MKPYRNLFAYAYAPSRREVEAHLKKYPALVVRKFSESALKKGARVDWKAGFEGNGTYPLRTLDLSSSSSIWCVGPDGALAKNDCDSESTGACVAFRAIYLPNSCLVRDVDYRNFEATIKSENGKVKVTSRHVPIVKFGNHEYIWYNEGACKKGLAKTMHCEILEMPEVAQPFDKDGLQNDYAYAKNLHKQYERILFDGATEEQKALVCKVNLVYDTFYQTLQRMISPEQEELIEKAKDTEQA